MEKMIRTLIRRHKTNCPFLISRELGIHIRFANLGKVTRGIYYRKLRRRFIVIHNNLCPNWQRFVCAHELGHDRLHRGISRFFLDENSFFQPGKFESQANRFAVHLLTAEDQLASGESIYEFCRRNGVPEEMLKFY